MKIESRIVALQRCAEYRRQTIKGLVERLSRALSFSIRPGNHVLIKPNLVCAQGVRGLPCTHPEFIAAVVEWLLDHGAKVLVGDSPAFGSAKGVMSACGITDALKGLPVKLLNFNQRRQVTLKSGISVGIFPMAMECDMLVSLPKIKAHSQLGVSLAVKNYFGAVVGFQKSWWHLRHGGRECRFASLLVDLLEELPDGISLADGILTMHVTGPVFGKPYALGLVGGSVNPVALDTALLIALGQGCQSSLIWRECANRKLVGSEAENIAYPLLTPEDMQVHDFIVPALLKPISFNPFRLMMGGIKRLAAGLD